MVKRRYNSNATQQDILDAAERLFAEQSFGEVSTSNIAKEAGVSQSQIHYHFKTKHKLWGAVFKRRFAEYFAVQSSTLEMLDFKGVERMDASIRAYFSFFRDNPQFVKLLGRAQLDDIKEDEEPMSSMLIQQGAEVIAEAQKDGKLRNDVSPQFILFGFLSLVAYWFQCRGRYMPQTGLAGDPQSYDDEYLDFILKVYLKGIAP